MTRIPLITDGEIDAVPIGAIIAAVRAHLLDDAEGRATAPARHSVAFPEGAIVFTTGGSGTLAGFRAYETFDSAGRQADDQVTIAWDRRTCRLKGIAIGPRLGAIRTGALGGLAIDIKAARAARRCAVIGSGLQAETQLLAASAVRKFDQVKVFSRDPGKRAVFAEKMRTRTGFNVIAAESARQCVEGAEVIILATDSPTPVISAEWVLPTAHVTTVGPKAKAGHELPLALAERAAVIASDSPQQVIAMGDRHFLADTSHLARIVHLGALARQFDPDERRGLTIYLSAGLAGSEVAALDAVLAHGGSGG